MNPLRHAKKHLIPALCKALVVFLGAPAAATAQESTDEPVQLQELTLQANQARQQRSTRALSVLLGWSALNIGVGTAGYFITDGATRYFHQMNAGWNVVNAAIAGFGIIGNRRGDPAEFSPMETMEEDYRLQKILLFNMGLNVAYMATGAYFWERGIRTDDERLRGYGPSLVAQGAFLLLFDTTFFWLQNRGAREYRRQLQVGWDDGPALRLNMTF